MATNTDFVSSLYTNILFRPASSAELSYLVTRLDNGLLTRQGLVETAFNLPDLKGMPYTLSAVYQAVFGALPTMSALTFWSGLMNQGATVSQVAQQMLTSPNAKSSFPSLVDTTSVLNKLSQHVLGRSLAAHEMAVGDSLLQQGNSLGQITEILVGLGEATTKNQTTLIKNLLWHAVIGNDTTLANLGPLPSDGAGLAVALVKQPDAPKGVGPFWESSTTLYGVADLTGVVSIDLTKNTLVNNTTAQTLTTGSMTAAINADMSGLIIPAGSKLDTKTTPQLVSFVGDAADNLFKGSAHGNMIDAGAGNDDLYLGSGIDLVKFASSASGNGYDFINSFTLGTDFLDFSRFLNKTVGAVNMIAIDSSKPLAVNWMSGDVLVVHGVDLTPTSIAALFGSGRAIAAPTGIAKAVVMTSGVSGSTDIWYLVNQNASSTITSDEIVKVATLDGINNLLVQKTLASLLASMQVQASAGSLHYSRTSLTESAKNDGSMTESITITLSGDSFAGSVGASLGAVKNLPAGLTAKLIKTADSEATLTLTGKATANALNNSIDNFTITFKDKDFLSAKLATGAIKDDIAINFIDLNMSESNGKLTIAGNVPAALTIDLDLDQMSSSGALINPLTVNVSSISEVDLHGITNATASILVNGGVGSEVFIASPTGNTLRGKGGSDGYLLGSGTDTIVFEATAQDNGRDAIMGFKVGTGGDKLDFSAFLTRPTLIPTLLKETQTGIKPAPTAWTNGNILLVEGEFTRFDATTGGYVQDVLPKDVEAMFRNDIFMAPTAQAKAVVILADITGDATVWYITNKINITSIDSGEAQQVATLVGVNNLNLAPFVAGNFVV